MPRFTRGTSRGRPGPRRLTQWFRSADVSAYTTLAGATAVLDQSLAGIVEPITAIRMRGQISVLSDQAAATERPFGAVGACVVSEQAFAIGVTAMPTPISDKDSDLWMMHQYYHAPVTFTDGTGYRNISETFFFDSKSMRKIPEGSRLVWVVENGSVSGVGILYLLQFAVLVKLA